MTTHKVYVIKGDDGYLTYDRHHGYCIAGSLQSADIIYRLQDAVTLLNEKKSVVAFQNLKIKVWEIHEEDLDTQD